MLMLIVPNEEARSNAVSILLLFDACLSLPEPSVGVECGLPSDKARTFDSG